MKHYIARRGDSKKDYPKAGGPPKNLEGPGANICKTSVYLSTKSTIFIFFKLYLADHSVT